MSAEKPKVGAPTTEEPSWMETGRLAEQGLRAAELVHELRQPVFSIKALVEIMNGEGTHSPHLSVLADQVRQLEVLLQRFSWTGQRGSGVREPVDLSHLVSGCVSALAGRARASEIQLSFVHNGQSRAILADPVAVRQIATNLVVNAIDAATSQVLVTVSGCSLHVHDDGAGISDDVQRRMFDPFFSTKPPTQGTGLGLPITLRLIAACEAALEWDSGVAGTEFCVKFVPLGADPALSGTTDDRKEDSTGFITSQR